MRGQSTRRSTGHYDVGARKGDGEDVTGTIMKYHRTGSLAEAQIQIDGGSLETLSVDSVILKVGSRVSFRRHFDATSPQGASAKNVKIL